MKICYIADGSSIHTQRWLSYFAQKGHEVHLLSYALGNNHHENVHLHPLVKLIPRFWPVTRYLSGFVWLFQVRRLIHRIKPDVVDVHYVTINGFLAAVSGFHPVVLTAWGSDVLINPKKNLTYRFLLKRAVAKADYILCSSPAVKDELVRLGANSDKAGIVFIGTNIGEFSPAQRDTMLMQRLDIPVASPVVISVRGFKPVYDVETLIKAIPLILKEAPRTRFIIAGKGEQREYLEKLVQDYGIHNEVRFVGWIPHDELPKYLASSDIYVSTSLSDGTSVSLLEAMSCGLAPVVSNIPANQLWITDGINGFLFPVQDYQSLAKNVVYLIKKAEKRSEFGIASRRIVQSKAGFETQIAEVEELYQRLIT